MIAGIYPARIKVEYLNGLQKTFYQTLNVFCMTMPTDIYLTAGREYRIYYNNLFYTDNLDTSTITVETDIPHAANDEYLLLDPGNDLTGTFSLGITVVDSIKHCFCSGNSTLHVSSPNANLDEHHRILLIGDSMTRSFRYPTQLYGLLTSQPNPQITMLGTDRNGNIAAEAYSGGMTWNWFVESEDSPFIYNGALDVSRYLQDVCNGIPPDYIVVFLGINGTYWVTSNRRHVIDQALEHFYFEPGHLLLDHMLQAMPDTKIALALITSGNYQPGLCYESWKPLTKYMNKRIVETFTDYHENLEVIPLHLCIDPWTDVTDNVHLTTRGNQRLAESVYNWLKFHFMQDRTMPLKVSPELVRNSDSTILRWDSPPRDWKKSLRYRIEYSPNPFDGFSLQTVTSDTCFVDSTRGLRSRFYRVTPVLFAE